jgi:hypothetical protein
MSYVMTDDDFNKLFVVKNQLGFMCSLVSTAERVECGVEELSSMLGALEEPIKNVMDSLEAREEISRRADTMNCFDWARVIYFVSGIDSMSISDIVKMDNKFAVGLSIDPDSKDIFKAWRNAITDEGKRPMYSTDNDMGGFHVKLNRPTQPELPPATEQSVLDMYGAKNAKDMLSRMVAMSNGADPVQLWEGTSKEKRKARKRAPVAA